MNDFGYSITRIIGGQRVTIALTKEEMDEISALVDKRYETDEIVGRLEEMEGEELLPGAAEALTDDDEFLHNVMERWEKNNGHGGDQDWNLDEAIMTILQQRPQYTKSGSQPKAE